MNWSMLCLFLITALPVISNNVISLPRSYELVKLKKRVDIIYAMLLDEKCPDPALKRPRRRTLIRIDTISMRIEYEIESKLYKHLMELLTECRKAKLDAKNTTEEPTIATKLPKSTTARPQQTTSTTPNMNTATGGRPTTTMSAIARDSPPTITVVTSTTLVVNITTTDATTTRIAKSTNNNSTGNCTTTQNTKPIAFTTTQTLSTMQSKHTAETTPTNQFLATSMTAANRLNITAPPTWTTTHNSKITQTPLATQVTLAIQTLTTQTIPTTTQTNTTTTETIPTTTTQTMPTTPTQTSSTTTQTIPTPTQTMPTTTGTMPSTTQTIPATTLTIPIPTQTMPTATEIMPTTTQPMPRTKQTTPTTTQAMPTTTQTTPTTTPTTATTTQTTSTTTQAMPTTTQTMPTTTETTPTTTQTMPTATQTMPTTTETAPTTTQTTPTVTKTTTTNATTPTTETTSAQPIPIFCLIAINLTESWRLDHSGSGIKPNNGSYNCDSRAMAAAGRPWFRFQGKAGNKMVDYCPMFRSCGTVYPIWSSDLIPPTVGVIYNITAYGNYHGNCRWFKKKISAMRCSNRPHDVIYRYDDDEYCMKGFCGMKAQ